VTRSGRLSQIQSEDLEKEKKVGGRGNRGDLEKKLLNEKDK
jgi:hypothetical protein